MTGLIMTQPMRRIMTVRPTAYFVLTTMRAPTARGASSINASSRRRRSVGPMCCITPAVSARGSIRGKGRPTGPADAWEGPGRPRTLLSSAPVTHWICGAPIAACAAKYIPAPATQIRSMIATCSAALCAQVGHEVSRLPTRARP